MRFQFLRHIAQQKATQLAALSGAPMAAAAATFAISQSSAIVVGYGRHLFFKSTISEPIKTMPSRELEFLKNQIFSP